MERKKLLAGILMAVVCGLGSRAEAFVATNFRVAASSAPVIVVAKVRKGREGVRILQVLRNIRGKEVVVGTHIPFNPNESGFQSDMLIGSTYLLLLSAEKKAFKTDNECGTTNALKVDDGMIANPSDFDPELKADGGSPRKILPLSEVEHVLRLEQR